MSLGAQLQKYRALAGLQYKELADLSGVDIGTINALEKRKSKRSEHAPALAKALGLSMEELLDAEADHSGQVLAHMARHRSQKGGTDAAKLLREGAASYRLPDTTHIPRLNPEQLRAMLTPEDIERIEAYAQAVIDMRAAEMKKNAA